MGLTKILRKGLGIRKYITSHLRIALYTVVLAVLLAVALVWPLRTLLTGKNLHTVIPNEVYRSAQPSPKALESWIEELSLRSVINLRGERKEPWFKDEGAVAKTHDVDFYSIPMTSGSLPSPHALRQLVHLLDTARRPVLLHCAYGIERSGIASAVAVLLAGGDVKEAREQFGLRYGFIRGFDDHPEILDNYEHWLALQEWPHTPDRFRHWVENDYVPSFYSARIEPLDVPTAIAKGTPVILRFRATNTSPKPWKFRSKRKKGISLGAKMLLLEPGVNGLTGFWSNKSARRLRGRLRDITVAPGETVVLELRVPPLRKPGRYQLFVDLLNKGWFPFSAMGSKPLIFELRVEASKK